MSESGEWDLIVIPPAPTSGRRAFGRASSSPQSPPGGRAGAVGKISFQKIMIVPAGLLAKVDNPQIIGVVSSSSRKSIKIYNQQDRYDHWYFFYGQTSRQTPEVVYFGETTKEE